MWFFNAQHSHLLLQNCSRARLSAPDSAERRADAAHWPGAAGDRFPPILPAESSAVLPLTPSPHAVTRVAWIPPRRPRGLPRLLLQQQWAGGRGGDCAIIGAVGSDEAPVDRRQVRRQGVSRGDRRLAEVVDGMRTAGYGLVMVGRRVD